MTLADRLRYALAAGPTKGTVLLGGDYHDAPPPEAGPLHAAAVLVPVTDRTEPGVIFTRRTDTMRRHPGQVAFPGGRIDPTDADAIEAALREAEEEISLPREQVTIVGAADRYRTVTGYDVTPILAVIPPDLVLVANADEVAHVFEAPLSFVLDPANHVKASTLWQGRERHYYEIMWGDNRIWGATAAMIVNLSRRLQWNG